MYRLFLSVLTVSLGEEADIVILSLVRNPGENKSGSIGFLKVPLQRLWEFRLLIFIVFEPSQCCSYTCPSWTLRFWSCGFIGSKE
jgi:hypothetical protein